MRTKKRSKIRGKYAGIFQKFFRNLPQLILANLMFAIPMIISFVIVWLIQRFLTTAVIIEFLPILLLMPFYCGLCKVTKDIAIGKEVKGISAFFKGVKANLKYSILHGVIFYIVALMDYFADIFYYGASQYNAAMYIVFGLCVAVTVFTIFCFFFVPLITVTVDLKFKHIYKNAALMAIGELPKCLLASLSVVCCIAIVTALFSLMGSYLGALLFVLFLLVFILPATISYFINAILYPSIEELLISKDNLKDKPTEGMSCEELLKIQFEENPIDPAILEGDENELVFYGGKMVKRSTLIEMYKSIDK